MTKQQKQLAAMAAVAATAVLLQRTGAVQGTLLEPVVYWVAAVSVIAVGPIAVVLVWLAGAAVGVGAIALIARGSAAALRQLARAWVRAVREAQAEDRREG